MAFPICRAFPLDPSNVRADFVSLAAAGACCGNGVFRGTMMVRICLRSSGVGSLVVDVIFMVGGFRRVSERNVLIPYDSMPSFDAVLQVSRTDVVSVLM